LLLLLLLLLPLLQALVAEQLAVLVQRQVVGGPVIQFGIQYSHLVLETGVWDLQGLRLVLPVHDHLNDGLVPLKGFRYVRVYLLAAQLVDPLAQEDFGILKESWKRVMIA